MKRTLNFEERIKIETLLKENYKPYQIADKLHRSRQTIYNEIKRGSVQQIDTYSREYKVYKADYGQRIKDINLSHRGAGLKIGSNFSYLDLIETIIKEKKYSPYSALQYIRKYNLCDDFGLCRNTIYNYVKKGLFYDLTYKDLPYGKRKKKKKNEQLRQSWKNTKGKSITSRPAVASDRIQIGHFEGDTVASCKGDKAALLVLTDRKSRKEIIRKIPNRESSTIVRVCEQIEKNLTNQCNKDLIKSITFDNGTEFMQWEKIENIFNCSVYFAHPYRACERGSNENQNRLIRRFIPKGSKISDFSEYQIQQIEDWINELPRKIFSGASANDMFMAYT